MGAWTQALTLACMAVALAGCGGSGTGADSSGQLEVSAGGIEDGLIGSGSLQQRKIVLRNGTAGAAKSVLVQVALDAHAIQLPLACEAGTQAVCKANADGTLTIDQLAAGASITLSQQLRIKPGYSGPVNNTWMVTTPDAALKAQWQQKLAARVADVGLTLQSNTASGVDAARTLSYAITLTNAGPDEARDVVWTQTAGIDMPLQNVKCTASGGAACPADLGASIKIAQLPKGGSLSLELSYGGRTDATRLNTEMLFSEVQTAGDPNAGNDRLLVRQPDAPGLAYTDGVYDLLDLEGHVGRLTANFQPGSYRELKFEVGGTTALAGLAVDVTGYVQIRRNASGTPSAWPFEGNFGTSLSGSTSNPIAGAFDFGQGLKPFIAARDWITDLSELDGIAYTLLGSRADASGKPFDAFARTARFASGVLSICEAETITPVEACPAAQLRRYEAAIVGRELELMSGTEMVRLRALRTSSGPVLVRSERIQDGSGSVFWVAIPQILPSAGTQPNGSVLTSSTLGSASGLAWPTSFGFDVDGQGQAQFLGPRSLPNNYLIYAQTSPGAMAELCSLQGSALPTAVDGLLEGAVNASSVFYPYGTAPPACYQGPVYFALSGKMAVMLGKKEGALGGRWMISTE